MDIAGEMGGEIGKDGDTQALLLGEDEKGGRGLYTPLHCTFSF